MPPAAGGGSWPGVVCAGCGSADVTAEGEHLRCRGCGRSFVVEDGILRMVVGARAKAGYDPHYFTTLPEVEADHFWFVARRELIFQALRSSVPDWRERPLFDIGCGSGGVLSFLEQSGVPLSGACDAYVEGLRIARQRVATPLVLVDEGSLPPLGPGQRMIGLFDVLEHLDDDAGMLAWIRSVLEPGGVLVLTVPAHPSLFDEADVLAQHRRRYRRRELRAKLAAAGLEVRMLTHFMVPLAPMLFVLRPLNRLLRRRSTAAERRDAELRITPWVNPLMVGLLRIERLLMRWTTLPLGTSLLAVAARPKSA